MNPRRTSSRLRRLREDREVLQMLNSIPTIGNENQGIQRINNLVNNNLNRLTQRLNNAIANLTEYINDSGNLNNLSDNELFDITNLIITNYTILEDQINRVGNEIEAYGRIDIIQTAIQLARRAELTSRRNITELRRRRII